MSVTKQWMATALAAALILASAPWTASAQEEAAPPADSVTAVPDTPPAPTPDPLTEAAIAGMQDALALLPDAVRASLSPDALREALLAATLRTADPRAEIGGESPAAARWDSGLLPVGSEGAPVVAHVAPGSPAAEAGIQPGDRLEEIDGNPAATGYDVSATAAALRIGEGAAFALKVRPADGSEPREIELVRSPIDGAASSERLPTGIGYIRFPCIGSGSAQAIAGALSGWTGDDEVAGLVLDLRGAGGDDADAVRDICALFALPGKILYRIDADTPAAVTVAAPALAERCRLPLMVLVDEGTTGAAELLAAALRGGAESALVIGRPTAGDPLLREPRTLPDGRPVRLAVHAIETADGTRYDGRTGVVPTLAIPDRALDEKPYEPDEPVLRKGKTLSDEEKEDRALRDRTRHDPYLRRAADVLLGLQAIGREWR